MTIRLLHRSCIACLLFSASGVLCAQSSFSYRIVDPDPNAFLYCHSIQRIGPDLYRLVGSSTTPHATAHFARMDLHADGSITNGITVPMDTNTAGYTRMILPTQDGGYLFAHLWAADGTDKQVFLKTDAAGNVEWNRYYPDNYGLLLIDVEQGMAEKDGHYFVFGHSQDVPATEGWACALLELDSIGAFVDLRLFAGGDEWSDVPRALIHSRSNGLMTVSLLRPYFSASTFPQISIQRWDASLGLSWSRNYSFGNYHQLTSVNELADGSLVITGQVRLSFGSGDFLPFIFKVDTLGQVVWSRRTQGTEPLLTDVVEEDDGSLVAVGWADHPLSAQLDSSGGLINASISGLSGSTSWPFELVRDSISDEHLVRCTWMPTILRLDSDLTFACDDQPYSWTDTLVAPASVDFPITVASTGPLASFDSTVVSQPVTFTTEDLCLSTGELHAARPVDVRAWPVPTTGPLSIAPIGASPVPFTVRDALGRVAMSGEMEALSGTFQLDIGALADGRYVLVMLDGNTMERVVVVKQ